MGAAHVHVYRRLFPAPAEGAWLGEDEYASELVLPGAEPALHWCVAVPGSQCPVASGHRREVPGMDLGRRVGRARGRVPWMRRCVAELRLAGYRAKRLHGGGPSHEVAINATKMSPAWQGPGVVFCRSVSWDAAQSAL